MILLVCVAFGFMAGLMTGGRLKNAAAYPLKALALPALAFLVKMGAARLFTPQNGAVAVCCAQYGLLALFILLNIRAYLWPAPALVGVLSNFLVIVLNGGCMPVAARLLESGSARAGALAAGRIYAYALINEKTVLPFLGDTIALGPRANPLGFASAGDLALCLGVGALCFFVTRGKAGYVRPIWRQDAPRG